MLSPIDSYLLSNSSKCQVVVKTSTLRDVGQLAAQNVSDLYAIHTENPTLNLFKLAGIGHSTNGVKDAEYRGDVRCWLTPSLCEKYFLSGVKKIISRIVAECQGRLKVEHSLNGHFSIQAALYPGNGARYVRHTDAGSKKNNNDLPNEATASRSDDLSGACPGKRRLTFIYYLNEPPAPSTDSTDASGHVGGNLRIYNVPKSESEEHEESYMDIEPTLGTLVVFRSDTVEHEVLPTFRDRWALTLWAYAHDYCSNEAEGVSPATVPSGPSATDSAPAPTSQEDNAPLRPPPLCAPRSKTALVEEKEETIFVSVISYRDSELPHTVRDLFSSAACPRRVQVGIVYQLHPSDEPRCRLQPRHLDEFSSGEEKERDGPGGFFRQHVRTLSLPHTEAKGPIFARHLAASLYGGEQFVLQIDSHMRFREGWDAYLVHLLRHIETAEGSDKVVLSTYPLGYHLPNRIPLDTRPTVLMPSRFDEHGFLRQEGKVLDRLSNKDTPSTAFTGADSHATGYFRSALWAAGFSFSRAALLWEVPYSPLLPHLFFGEEVSMAVRLHTHGWDLFCPDEAVLYHLYSRQHRATFQELQQPQQLNNSTTNHSALSESIVVQKQRSMRVVQCMLGLSDAVSASSTQPADATFQNLLRLSEKHFGLGTVRTLQSFWDRLALLGVTPPSLDASSPDITTKAGSVTRIDAQRIAFLFPRDSSIASRFAFAQSALSGAAVPPDAAGDRQSTSTDSSSADARLMALLTSVAGVEGRIQGFL